MTLDEAIQHCKEQVQEQAKRGCYSCAEEHQQLAEWLKELKAYKEQRGKRMNESEKERLIKKDIESIENRVRHAFNQGYEMGLKESRSENPNTCGDAISRQAVMDCFKKWQPYMATRLWDFEQELSALPSVTPQQRMGRWIDAEVLDKIRAEIDEQYDRVYPYDISCAEGLEMALGIIDKYKAESEE